MADGLDELLTRSLVGAGGDGARDASDQENLGARVRQRAARQDRVRRVAIAGGALAVTLGATVLMSNYRRDTAIVEADAHKHLRAVERHVAEITPSDEEIRVLVDELDSTSRLIREAIEQMRSDDETQRLRQQLVRLEMPSTVDPAIDQTVAMGIADAKRLAAARPQEATERLTRLVELFPESGLAATARQQLNQLQTQEVMQ